MGQNRHKSLGAACSLFAPPSNSKRPLVKASSLIFAQVGGLRLFEVFSIVLSDIYVRFDSARRRIVSPKRPCSPNPTLNLSRHANQPRPQPSPFDSSLADKPGWWWLSAAWDSYCPTVACATKQLVDSHGPWRSASRISAGKVVVSRGAKASPFAAGSLWLASQAIQFRSTEFR